MLDKLSNAVGISGYEEEIAELIKSEMEKYTDSVEIDTLGNVIGLKKGNGKGKIMLAAHMDEIGLVITHIGKFLHFVSMGGDEIGFVVSHIDKNGFIFVSPVGGINVKTLIPVGGINVKTLIGTRVIVHGEGKYYGVMGSIPPHMKKEKEKELSIEDIFVDIGAKNKDEVLKRGIDIGSIITYEGDAFRKQVHG